MVSCAGQASPSPTNGLERPDDASLALRKRRTIESTQPPTTRTGNSGSKHFNYNKLVNDRAATLGTQRFPREARDAHSKSLNQGKISMRAAESAWGSNTALPAVLPPSSNVQYLLCSCLNGNVASIIIGYRGKVFSQQLVRSEQHKAK